SSTGCTRTPSGSAFPRRAPPAPRRRPALPCSARRDPFCLRFALAPRRVAPDVCARARNVNGCPRGTSVLRKLLFLQPGGLRRLLPFFGLYLLAFAALTLADGLSLALFVNRAGADRLPLAYGLTALANLLLIGLYLLVADRLGAVRLFQVILGGSAGAYLAAWAAVRFGGGGEGWYVLLFAGREITFTLVLMHFGTFVQAYFTRAEMNRVLPLIYAGGRVGGIAGGCLLQRLSGVLELTDLALVFAGLSAACMAVLSAGPG